ncbi:26S proteasome non-ATPase regulatory subunit 4-like [Biomphalaria glabrata]|uniref:26S proteasome non-ATPase regulatory subunit 4 n=1 Tax=Biomphalaria glabrata TaxID=6526 RepID=A0A9U8E3F9_BIOGL|nr:26S proteasome non-ATPase regulatory subunit 4-like [Biomphalaria glabrata]
MHCTLQLFSVTILRESKMVLESTIICVDNSDYMRNGDFVPTRMQAQQDAVNLVCMSKTRSNPENNVGLLKMAQAEVLVTLTSDVGRILAKLHQVQPCGEINFLTAVRVAHLALKHRQGRNHKLRIVVFVGSPIQLDEKELVKVAKRLKKEKVNVDVVNFGEESINTDKLTAFVNAINGKDGTSSHLVTVPPGPMLSDALLSSPVIVGEDGTGANMTGAGFEFGVDPNEDPELALALRVSMEEQRARQERELRENTGTTVGESGALSAASVDEEMLERALGASLNPDESLPQSTNPTPQAVDFASMSEEEQVAYAVRLSMENTGGTSNLKETSPAPMETDIAGESVLSDKKEDEEDYSEVMNDPDFLQNVFQNLPGVDPNSEVIQSAMSNLLKDTKKDDKKEDKK